MAVLWCSCERDVVVGDPIIALVCAVVLTRIPCKHLKCVTHFATKITLKGIATITPRVQRGKVKQEGKYIALGHTAS